MVEETRGPRDNHRPVASHSQTLSHNVVHLALIKIRTHNISGDRYYYHTITATTVPLLLIIRNINSMYVTCGLSISRSSGSAFCDLTLFFDFLSFLFLSSIFLRNEWLGKCRYLWDVDDTCDKKK